MAWNLGCRPVLGRGARRLRVYAFFVLCIQQAYSLQASIESLEAQTCAAASAWQWQWLPFPCQMLVHGSLCSALIYSCRLSSGGHLTCPEVVTYRWKAIRCGVYAGGLPSTTGVISYSVCVSITVFLRAVGWGWWGVGLGP